MSGNTGDLDEDKMYEFDAPSLSIKNKMMPEQSQIYCYAVRIGGTKAETLFDKTWELIDRMGQELITPAFVTKCVKTMLFPSSSEIFMNYICRGGKPVMRYARALKAADDYRFDRQIVDDVRLYRAYRGKIRRLENRYQQLKGLTAIFPESYTHYEVIFACVY